MKLSMDKIKLEQGVVNVMPCSCKVDVIITKNKVAQSLHASLTAKVNVTQGRMTIKNIEGVIMTNNVDVIGHNNEDLKTEEYKE